MTQPARPRAHQPRHQLPPSVARLQRELDRQRPLPHRRRRRVDQLQQRLLPGRSVGRGPARRRGAAGIRHGDSTLDHGDHECGGVLAVISHRAAAFPGVEFEASANLGEVRGCDVGSGADDRALQGQIARVPVDGDDPPAARVVTPAGERPRSDLFPDLRQVDPAQLVDGTAHGGAH